jgi:hypothetical protein
MQHVRERGYNAVILRVDKNETSARCVSICEECAKKIWRHTCDCAVP